MSPLKSDLKIKKARGVVKMILYLHEKYTLHQKNVPFKMTKILFYMIFLPKFVIVLFATKIVVFQIPTTTTLKKANYAGPVSAKKTIVYD